MISTDTIEGLGVGGEAFDYSLEKDGEYSFISNEALQLGSQQACTNIVIMGLDGEIGRLSWNEGCFTFTGDMAESAKIFFDNFLKPLVDDYIQTTAQGNPVPRPM